MFSDRNLNELFLGSSVNYYINYLLRIVHKILHHQNTCVTFDGHNFSNEILSTLSGIATTYISASREQARCPLATRVECLGFDSRDKKKNLVFTGPNQPREYND